MRLSKSRQQYYQEVADAYEREVLTPQGLVAYTVTEVVEWAMLSRRLEFSKKDAREVHCWRMSTSLNADSSALPDGSRVRNRYCVAIPRTEPEQQKTLWAHVDNASREFLRQSLLQQMKSIGKDVLAWKKNYCHINERLLARGERKIQMSIEDYLGRLGNDNEEEDSRAS